MAVFDSSEPIETALRDPKQLGEVLDQYRDRMRRLVQLRLDRRVQARIDSSDVIQEAFVEVNARLPSYLANPSMPFFAWVRFLVGQKILELHRRHLGVQARDAARDISLHHGTMPEASSRILAAHLADLKTGPQQQVVKEEMKRRVQAALDNMKAIDREILALRHFEQLSMSEAADVLGIKLTTACNRYVRALDRLKQQLPNGFWS